MARINLEDKYFNDPRRTLLITTIGQQFIVDGVFVSIIRLAQDYYKRGEYMPLSLFKKIPYSEEFLEVGFCEVIDDTVRLDGTSKHLTWLKERLTAAKTGGSKISNEKRDAAKKREAKKRELVEMNEQSDHKQTQANTSKTAKAQASSSSSFSLEKEYGIREQVTAQEPIENQEPLPMELEQTHPIVLKLKPIDLVSIWNELKSSHLSAVSGLSPDRERKAHARLKEHPLVEIWEEVMARINSSKFLTGRVSVVTGERKKPWRADFDWLLKPGNVERVLEGKYDQ